MARKRIYELLNQAVLTVSDYFMVDKSGNTEAKRVSGQVILDFIKNNLATVADTGSYNDLSDTPTLVEQFTDLSDVPASYSGQTGKFVKVNAGEDGLEFATVSVSDTNIYNTNGTLTGNRTVTHAGYSLSFGGTTRVVSPSASALDTAFAVRNNTDTANMLVQNGAGRIGVNANPLASARVYVVAPNGEYAGYFEGSDDNAIYASSTGGRGVYAFSTNNRGIEAISTNSYGVHAKSANNYALWAQSTSAGTKLSIFSNGQCDFKDYADTLTILKLHDGGKVSMPNLPTSSAGLSAGDLWNDSGTLKIA